MATKKQLVQITELAIDNLITTFKTAPYFFYTENDLHCYLYTQILNRLPMKDWLCKTADGKDSILLHKEYPTKERYSRKALEEGLKKGSRGHFDLSIWNSEQVGRRFLRASSPKSFGEEQQTFIVIEFDLNEGNASLDDAFHHLKWDRIKLKSKKNEVEHGYLLVFARDWIHSKDFLERAKHEVSREEKVVILYIEKSKNQTKVETLSRKQFLNYTMR
jgi:hypothetical protein